MQDVWNYKNFIIPNIFKIYKRLVVYTPKSELIYIFFFSSQIYCSKFVHNNIYSKDDRHDKNSHAYHILVFPAKSLEHTYFISFKHFSISTNILVVICLSLYSILYVQLYTNKTLCFFFFFFSLLWIGKVNNINQC